MTTDTLDRNLVQKIATEVDDIAPYDELEQTHQSQATAWLRSGANPFRIRKPDTPPMHLVSYFVLVDPDHHSILLVDHIKAQLWLPTGGHVMWNEHPRDAVIREAREELDLEAIFLRGHNTPFFITSTVTVGLTPGHTDVSLWYLLRGNIHTFLHTDKIEFHDTEWYTFKEVLDSDPIIFDPHLPRFTHKLAATLG